MSTAAGKVYGPYRVVRPLGSGGMGTVLLAEDPRLGRFVALKTFSGPESTVPNARDHLLREARAAAAFTHPNIAAVHDVLDIDGQVVIVFEFVEGETLQYRLQRGPMPLGDALRIGIQLADALAVAHAHGVIHRDLKPANIILTTDEVVKVLDFGIARAPASEPDRPGTRPAMTTRHAVGTPGYAAPEQWLGDPADARTDIFALGVVLFEMLTGHRPFTGDSAAAILRKTLVDEPPHPREHNAAVPLALDALISRALSRERDRRPQTARELRDVLRRVSAELDSRTLTRTFGEQTGRRWAIGTALALMIAIGALIATLLIRKAPPPPNAPPVVAVLPWTNATGSQANDYLAAGIADSLTTNLAGLRGITVLSRSAVLQEWNRQPEPDRVASKLGASYLVEGSVQRFGDRIRLSASLVRPDRSLAWADSVEGVFESVFELQSRLASALGRALVVQLSAAERARLAEQPTRNTEALAAYWRGRGLLDRRDVPGNLEAALAAFDEAVRLDPRFAIAHAARGEALWARYQSTNDRRWAQEAIDAGTTALRLEPDHAQVRYLLAVTLAGSGRHAEATEELQLALTLQPNYDDARRQLGVVLTQQGRFDEAVAEFRRAISLRPDYWGHYNALGSSLLLAARYPEAVDAFKRVVELQPDNYIGYSNLGSAYQFVGDAARALEFFKKANAITPTGQAYSNIGFLHHQRREYAEAVEAYRQAIALRPNSAQTHRNLGDALIRLGRLSEAQTAYLTAVRLTEAELGVNPRDARNLAALAVYLAKTRNDAGAQQRLDEARSLAPDDVQVWYRAAVVHALAGRQEAALDALSRALELGYSRSIAAADDDFEKLRPLPRFQALVAPAPGGSSR